MHHWFSGMLAPFPSDRFDIKSKVTVEEYAIQYSCSTYSGAPCTLALYMRKCGECQLIRR